MAGRGEAADASRRADGHGARERAGPGGAGPWARSDRRFRAGARGGPRRNGHVTDGGGGARDLSERRAPDRDGIEPLEELRQLAAEFLPENLAARG